METALLKVVWATIATLSAVSLGLSLHELREARLDLLAVQYGTDAGLLLIARTAVRAEQGVALVMSLKMVGALCLLFLPLRDHDALELASVVLLVGAAMTFTVQVRRTRTRARQWAGSASDEGISGHG